MSLALNNDSRIAAETKSRIKQLAVQRGYVPNNFGRGLQTGRSCLAGYLAATVTESFFNIILQGISEAATVANYGLLTALTADTAAAANIRLFLEKNVDGVIIAINYSRIPAALKMLEARRVPVVFCSIEDSGPHPHVITDNFAGGRMAAEHLIALGHRCLACCGIDSSRLDGNLDIIGQSGLPAPLIFEKSDDLTAALKTRRITGIIAYSDQQAIAIKHLAGRLGLRIPEDISIVGFDDLWFARLEEFSFTTIAQPKTEIGMETMNLLLRMTKSEPVENVLLKPELIVRKSTAPPAFK
ncbi:MAG: LacI family DNA-binding transcriptional regulator [Victivallales bacterium]|nr:LacI family DNA-binding transcriptional regulator [Victivallales bacterium]